MRGLRRVGHAGARACAYVSARIEGLVRASGCYRHAPFAQSAWYSFGILITSLAR